MRKNFAPDVSQRAELYMGRPLKNTLFVIASEAKQSHKPLIIKEIATAHMRLAMTVSWGSGLAF